MATGAERLFVYGTLRDPDVQERVFGYHADGSFAQLSDWGLFCDPESGYLFIKPDQGHTVDGEVLIIDAKALRRADLWEEVPVYRRERVVVTLESGSPAEVWTYTKREAAGARHSPGTLSAHDRATVLSAIETTLSQEGGEA